MAHFYYHVRKEYRPSHTDEYEQPPYCMRTKKQSAILDVPVFVRGKKKTPIDIFRYWYEPGTAGFNCVQYPLKINTCIRDK